jgi:excisionase family DNA binding protein
MPITAIEIAKNPQKMYRAQEVAAQWGCSAAMAYKLMASGAIPTVRLGRSVRVPQRALEEWIAKNTTGGEDTAA